MNNGWTPERRAMQSKLIKGWKPWKHATGPKTPEGKATVSRNAWKGGERPAMRVMFRHMQAELDICRRDWLAFLGETK